MFGTLKPQSCRLGCDRQHEYATFYCGLCQSLGDHFGQLSRGMLNYDAVFLALVADGLVDEGAAPDRCRCPILPVVFRPTVRPDSPAMRYAAAMQVLLADQWLADRAMDGKRLARAARPLLSGKVETARAVLGDLGISLADLDGFEEVQAGVEVAGRTGPREAAEPTAAALERVFDRMALLPGVPETGRTPEARRALGAFGRHLGSAIYLIDALDDLEKDQRGGAFNPCLIAGEGTAARVSWARVESAWALLHDDLAALGELSAALPLRRHQGLVRSVVAVELPRLARAAAQRAHTHARAEHARERAEVRARPWPRRALAAAATVFVLLWVWLSAIPALAQSRRRPSSPPRRPDTADAGAAPATSAPPEEWEPHLPPAPSTTAPPEGSAHPRPGGGSAPGTTPGDGTPGGGTTPPPPAGGGGGGNPCSACFDTCTSFCKSCSGCCDVCKSGDCGGCGKICSSCGSCNSCCNGCNCGSCGR